MHVCFSRLRVNSVQQASFTSVKCFHIINMFMLCFNGRILCYLVTESPVKKILQCGNLTGNARRVRDLAADLFSLIQRWNTQHLLGVQLLNSIMSMKLPVL